MRLAVLNRIGVLTDEERTEFADGLWSKLDSAKRLPADTYMLDFSFLHLPEPEPGKAKQNLSAFLLGQEIPRMAERIPDNRLKYTQSIGDQALRFFQQLRGATLPLLPAPELADKYIDWTPDQAVMFLEKAWSWWNQEKDLLTHPRLKDEVRDVKACFEGSLKVVGDIILPRLPAQTHGEDADRALALITGMRDAGISILEVLPATLFVTPERGKDVTQELRTGLLSSDEYEVRQAIFAVESWAAKFAKQRLVLALPCLLLDELVNKVRYRSQPALASGLGTIANMVKNTPQIFTQAHFENLVLTLEQLATETALEPASSAAFQEVEDKSKGVDLPDRPTCRRYAARLASNLAAFFRNKGESLPAALVRWESICMDDPLPEVRRAWKA